MDNYLPEKTRSLIAALPAPKSPGTLTEFDGAAPRMLHLNESPYPPSPLAVQAMAETARFANRYPDPNSSPLVAELARRNHVDANRIVIGSGLEDIIRIVVELFIDVGDESLVPAPSFPFFAVATNLQRGRAIRIGIKSNGANDVHQMLAKVGNRTRVAFCCTPNPPNGAATASDDVEGLAKDLPQNITLVLDEAYREFAIHAGEPDLLPSLARHRENWVCLRTFSKAYGLAGMRVGYAICGTSGLAEAIRKFRLQYSPSLLAQSAALAALQDDAYLASVLDRVASERERVSEGLRRLGLTPYPSVANFVSVKMPYSGLACASDLARKGVLVRDWRDPDYPNEIRMSVGTSQDTDDALHALSGLLQTNRQ